MRLECLTKNNKYISKLTEGELSFITNHFVKDEGFFAKIWPFTKGAFTIILNNGHEYHMDDYMLAEGYGVKETDSTEYALFMVRKFGLPYINDFATRMFGKQIKEAEKNLQDITHKRDDFVSEMQQIASKAQTKEFVEDFYDREE